MCRSKAEGQRRCAAAARQRARARDVADLCPGAASDRPAVQWGPETTQDLVEKFGPAADLALEMLEQLHAIEPGITSDVIAAIPAGAWAHALAFRMKSPASLADKIYRKAEAAGLPLQAVCGGMTDLVRYTAVADTVQQLVPTAQATVQELVTRGWVVNEAEQSFVEGNPYKGLHVLLRHPSGTVTEVQFHTRAAIVVKDERGHHDYELERDINAELVQRALARERMVDLWQEIDTPPGLEQLQLGGVTVVRKTYPERPEYRTALEQLREEKRT